MRFVNAAGKHWRVVDPTWSDPLNADYSRRHGGRWNAPNSYPVLYLNCSVRVARLNAEQKLAQQRDLGIDLDMLAEAALPSLVPVDVPSTRVGDLATESGLAAVGLPRSYPWNSRGEPIPHAACWHIGATAHAAGVAGLRVRSAAGGASRSDRELVWFSDNGGKLQASGRTLRFAEWFDSETI